MHASFGGLFETALNRNVTKLLHFICALLYPFNIVLSRRRKRGTQERPLRTSVFRRLHAFGPYENAVHWVAPGHVCYGHHACARCGRQQQWVTPEGIAREAETSYDSDRKTSTLFLEHASAPKVIFQNSERCNSTKVDMCVEPELLSRSQRLPY